MSETETIKRVSLKQLSFEDRAYLFKELIDIVDKVNNSEPIKRKELERCVQFNIFPYSFVYSFKAIFAIVFPEVAKEDKGEIQAKKISKFPLKKKQNLILEDIVFSRKRMSKKEQRKEIRKQKEERQEKLRKLNEVEQ